MVFPVHPLSPSLSDQQPIVATGKDNISADEVIIEKSSALETKKSQNYLSQSAVFLRCRVLPPPCIKNPYLTDVSEVGIDPFGNQRSKCAGTFLLVISEYHDQGRIKLQLQLLFIIFLQVLEGNTLLQRVFFVN